MAPVPAMMTARRRSLQFSLRSFLTVLIGIAILVGFYIKVAKTITSRNAAIDAIGAEDDGLVFLFSADGRHIIDSGDGDPHHIMVMNVDPQVVADSLQRCTEIKSLVEICLTGSTFDPEKLANVTGNPRVHKLTLDYCSGLSPETCSLLVHKFPQLREISVANSDIGKDGLAALREMERLRTIDVSDLPITATDIVQACVLFPALKHLVIEHADLSGQLKHFCSLPYLEKLDVSFGSFSASDLASFLDCTACNEIIVICVELDRSELESLVRDKDKLKIIDWGRSTE